MTKKKDPPYRLDVARFERETSRLGPAVVGAYIRILLDYFEHREAPPDDDAVLARIAGCDPDTWAAIRIKLEPLFQIVDAGDRKGLRWFHEATDADIGAAVARKVHSAKAADAAVAARVSAPAESTATHTQVDGVAGTLVTEPGALDDFDDGDDLGYGEPEPPVPTPVGISFEGPLDPNFKPSPAQIVEHMAEGYTSEVISEVLDAFKRYNINMGSTSPNWPELWQRWWNRKKPPLHPAEKKQPKPRVEVSRRAPPPTS